MEGIKERRHYQPVIECDKVVKRFYLTRDRYEEVLHEVSFGVEAGEFVILFGPSGCGKSTVLNLVAGLEMPTSGQLKIRGRDMLKMNTKELTRHHRTKIGMVFQQFNLINNLTVLDNVALPQAFSGDPLAVRAKRARHLLEMFRLEELGKKLPNELSGGEQQRVAIARALANNPWILLIDEPTGNLDSKSAEEVMEIVAGLNQKSKRTILMVTHNPDYLHFAHQIFYMKDGRIVDTKRNRPVIHRRKGRTDVRPVSPVSPVSPVGQARKSLGPEPFSAGHIPDEMYERLGSGLEDEV